MRHSGHIRFVSGLLEGLVRAAIDGGRIAREAADSIRFEFRLALILAERGLHRDDVMTIVTPTGEWVILPDEPAIRLG